MCSQTVECDPTEWLWSIVSTEIWMRSNFMIQLWEDWAVTERLNGWWSLTCYFSLQTRNHPTNISGPGPGDPGLRYRRSQMKHPVKSPEEVRLRSHQETSSRHQNTYSVVSSCTVERVCFYCTADSGWSPLFTPLSVDPTLCFHLWHSDGVHRVQSVLRRGEWGGGWNHLHHQLEKEFTAGNVNKWRSTSEVSLSLSLSWRWKMFRSDDPPAVRRLCRTFKHPPTLNISRTSWHHLYKSVL